MGTMTKNQYEQRKENAAKRMFDNKKINTLSEQQHEDLARICSMRHELHSKEGALWYSEGSDFNKFNRWVIGDEDDSFYELFKNVGINAEELRIDPCDLPDDDSLPTELGYPDTDEEEYQDAYEEAFAECLEFESVYNRMIESRLRQIDQNHGTNYCPTGMTRLLS